MKHLRITVEGRVYEVAVEILGTESAAEAQARPRPASASARAAAAAPAQTVATPVSPAAAPTSTPTQQTAAAPAAANSGGAAVATADAVCSPLTALVVSVDVSVGQQVSAGDRLITLEAMKMNTIVNATRAGTVSAIHVASADAVEEGQPLVTVE